MSGPDLNPPCGRCGKTYDLHPGGFCPDQVGTDGLVNVADAESFQWPEDEEQDATPEAPA